MAPTDIQRELQRLEADLKRLESEYNMFFAGRLPRPPWESRSRVEALVRQHDRSHIPNYGDRFRFETLQARFAALVEMWDRGLKTLEEGRPGPRSPRRPPAVPQVPVGTEERVLQVASFRDPLRETGKLRDLYESLTAARREAGDEEVPFDRFAELVKSRVARMTSEGTPEVAFRVAVKNGKVSFTARAVKGSRQAE
jgi:hypothetical protein